MDKRPKDTTESAEIISLAEDILDIARNRLLVNLRYMDVALTFHVRAVYSGSVSADRKALYFDPAWVIRTYQASREEITRIYLHLVLHCIFLHQTTGSRIDRPRWDLACDIAAEAAINDLRLTCTHSDRQDRQLRYIREIKAEVKYLTAEKIYAWLGKCQYSEEKLNVLREVFCPDDHSTWYEADHKQGTAPQAREHISGPSQDIQITDDDQWKNIAKQIEMELEIFGKVRGESAGTLIQNIRAVTRERYDYTDFLRKFAAMGEEIKVSDDEFDYIYYTYGLRHYRNMPLIEPLEYREDHRIRDFVIAIDTSGSVAGEEVQTFLRRTYGILNQQGSFFRDINVHIIQCDAEVQDDTVITCTEDFDRYLETMEIRGLGGTDFRPVFTYVEQLIRDGAFTDLKGLIYFTDGLGTYPENKPPYKTAFVFVDDGYHLPAVPVWAIRVLLQQDELHEGI
jgi:predicted metal-dependent peptidase